jgi:hypothetical protein
MAKHYETTLECSSEDILSRIHIEQCYNVEEVLDSLVGISISLSKVAMVIYLSFLHIADKENPRNVSNEWYPFANY